MITASTIGAHHQHHLCWSPTLQKKKDRKEFDEQNNKCSQQSTFLQLSHVILYQQQKQGCSGRASLFLYTYFPFKIYLKVCLPSCAAGLTIISRCLAFVITFIATAVISCGVSVLNTGAEAALSFGDSSLPVSA